MFSCIVLGLLFLLALPSSNASPHLKDFDLKKGFGKAFDSWENSFSRPFDYYFTNKNCLEDTQYLWLYGGGKYERTFKEVDFIATLDIEKSNNGLKMNIFNRRPLKMTFKTDAGQIIIMNTQIDDFLSYWFTSNLYDGKLDIRSNEYRIGVDYLIPNENNNWKDLYCPFPNTVFVCNFFEKTADHLQTVSTTDENSIIGYGATTESSEDFYLIMNSKTETFYRDSFVLNAKVKETMWFELKYYIYLKANATEPKDEIWFSIGATNNMANKETILISSNDVVFNEKLINPFESNFVIENRWEQQHVYFNIKGAATLNFNWKTNGNQNPSMAFDELSLRSTNGLDRNDFCSFSVNFCWFYQNKKASHSFVIGRGFIEQPISLFKSKRLFEENANRMFLYTDFSKSDFFEPLKFITMYSKYFTPPTSGEMCVEMFFVSLFFAEKSRGSFAIHTEDVNSQLTEIFFTELYTVNWTKMRIAFKTKHKFRFIISARNQDLNSNQVMFAMRDFHVMMHNCHDTALTVWNSEVNELSCNFQIDLCGWRNQGKQNWIIHNEVKNVVPSLDNVAERIKFKYALLKPSNGSSVAEGELRSDIFAGKTIETFCLKITYNFKNSLGYTSLLVLQNGENILFSSKEIFSQWSTEEITFSSTLDQFLILKGKTDGGAISIYNFKVTHGACFTPELKLDKFSCYDNQPKCGIKTLESKLPFKLTPVYLNKTYGIPKIYSEQVLAVNLDRSVAPIKSSIQLPTLRYVTVGCLRFWMYANVPLTLKAYNFNDLLLNYKFETNLKEWNAFEIELNSDTIDWYKEEITEIKLTIEIDHNLQGFVAFDYFLGYKGKCVKTFCDMANFSNSLWKTDIKKLNYFNSQGIEQNSAFIYKTYISPLILMESDSLENNNIPYCFEMYYGTEKQSQFSLLLEGKWLKKPQEIVFQDLVPHGHSRSRFNFEFSPFLIETSLRNQIEMKGKNRPFRLRVRVLPQAELEYFNLTILPGKCSVEPEHFECEEKVINESQVCDQVIDCKKEQDEKKCGILDFKRNFNLHQWGYSVKNSKLTHWDIITTSKLNEIHNKLVVNDNEDSFFVAFIHPEGDKYQQVQLLGPRIHRTFRNGQVEIEFALYQARLSVYVQVESSKKLFELYTRSDSTDSTGSIEFTKVTIPIPSIRVTFRLLILVQHVKVNLAPVSILNQVKNDLTKEVKKDWPTVLIKKINVPLPKSMPYPTLSYPTLNMLKVNMNEGTFKCSTDKQIAMELVCNFQNDCDDLSDEMNCSYDFYRNNFENDDEDIHLLNVNGFWQRESTKGQLSSGPTIDPSNDHFEGHYLILRNQKQFIPTDDSSSNDNDSIIKGELAGYWLRNRGHCKMRFSYQAKVESQVHINFRWKFFHRSLQKKSISVSLPPADSWTKSSQSLQFLPSNILVNFKMEVTLEANDDYFAIDDISFASSCYGLESNLINCEFSQLDSFCDWNVFEQKNPQRNVEQIENYQPFTSSNDDILRLVPLRREPSKSFLLTPEQPPKLNEFVLFSFPFNSDLKHLELYKESYRQHLRLTSPQIEIDSYSNQYIYLRYIAYGYNVLGFRLWDEISKSTLFEMHSISLKLTPIEKYIALNSFKSQSMILSFDINISGQKSYIQIQEIKIENQLNLQEIENKKGECSFDFQASCQLFSKTNLLIQQWIYSLNNPLPVADQTLASRLGSFIYATSNTKESKKLWFDWPANRAESCLSFWYTNFVLNRSSLEIMPRFETDVNQIPFELVLEKSPFDLNSKLFRSKAHLNGEWQFVSISLKKRPSDGYLLFKASFDLVVPQLLTDELHVIAIDSIKTESNCHVIECDIGLELCDWHNSLEPNLMKWTQINYETWLNEDLPSWESRHALDEQFWIVEFSSTSFSLSQKAELHSSAILNHNSKSICLEIEVAFEKECLLSLSILTDDGLTERCWQTIKNDKQSTSKVWSRHFVEIQLNNQIQSEQIRLRAQLEKEPKTPTKQWVAIRRIVYHSTSCSNVQSAPKSKKQEVLTTKSTNDLTTTESTIDLKTTSATELPKSTSSTLISETENDSFNLSWLDWLFVLFVICLTAVLVVIFKIKNKN